MAKDEKQIYEEILQSWKAPEGKSVQDAWSELQSKLPADETPVRRITPVRKWVGIAASVAVLLAFFWWNGSGKGAEVEVRSFTEMVEHQLPDGSVAYLNAGSAITYVKELWDEERKLDLVGEAYFDVEKGSSFTVKTVQGSVKVLGTEFNVFSRPEGFEVKCYEGKVQVNANNAECILTPGKMTSMSNSRLMGALDFNNNSTHWKDGEFNWEEVSLGNVFKEVERHFGVKIDAGTNAERTYSGFFAKSDLDEVLTLICEPMGLKYQKDSNGNIRVESDSILD